MERSDSQRQHHSELLYSPVVVIAMAHSSAISLFLSPDSRKSISSFLCATGFVSVNRANGEHESLLIDPSLAFIIAGATGTPTCSQYGENHLFALSFLSSSTGAFRERMFSPYLLPLLYVPML